MKHATLLQHLSTPPQRRHTHKPSLTVSEQLREDVEAFRRSGACDTLECEGFAIEAFARLRRLTFRQAERVWASVSPVQFS